MLHNAIHYVIYFYKINSHIFMSKINHFENICNMIWYILYFYNYI